MNDSNNLLVRMNRLERQHRRLRLFFTGALVLLGVALVSGQAGPQSKPKQAQPLRRIEAQKFVLVDAHGTEWGLWSAGGGAAAFNLGKPGSKRNVSIVVTKGTTGIAINYGDLSGIFGTTGDEMMLSVGDKVKGLGLELIANDHSATLRLLDEEFVRGSWIVDSGGHTTIALHDKSGQARSAWGVLSDGQAGIELRDKSGKRRTIWAVSNDEKASLGFYDKSGQMRASLGNTGVEVTKTGEVRQLAESSLVLFDKDGKVLFEAP